MDSRHNPVCNYLLFSFPPRTIHESRRVAGEACSMKGPRLLLADIASFSEMGQKQTLPRSNGMSALPPKADIRPRDQDVCFAGTASRRIATKLKLVFFMAGSPVFLNRQRANTRKRYVFLAWKCCDIRHLIGRLAQPANVRFGSEADNASAFTRLSQARRCARQ